MSTHPNAMLVLVLTPDDLVRKTWRAILAEASADEDGQIKIGDHEYNHLVMEDSYDESWQISAPVGSIVVHRFLTYGYGGRADWGKVQAAKEALEQWAKGICERHHCKAEISIGANYW